MRAEGSQWTDNCEQLCECTDGSVRCYRLRKEFSTVMTEAERVKYVNAVLAAARAQPEAGAVNNKWQEAVFWHQEAFSSSGIHGTGAFLPWHRWFLMTMENILREVTGDCTITVPYFDWRLQQHWPLSQSTLGMWDDDTDGLGGVDGGSAPSPFANWQVPFMKSGTRILSQPMTRSLGGTSAATVQDVQNLNRFGAQQFGGRSGFRVELEYGVGLHGHVHGAIGGTMSSGSSAGTPEFFMHHAMIDKVWADWQSQSEEHMQAYVADGRTAQECFDLFGRRIPSCAVRGYDRGDNMPHWPGAEDRRVEEFLDWHAQHNPAAGSSEIIGVKYVVDPDMAALNSITINDGSSELLADGRKAAPLGSEKPNNRCGGLTVVKIEWLDELTQFYSAMGMSAARIEQIKARYAERDTECTTADRATFDRLTAPDSIDRELGMAGLSTVLPARRARFLRARCANSGGAAVCRRVRAFDARRLARRLRRKNRDGPAHGTLRCDGATCWHDLDGVAENERSRAVINPAAVRSPALEQQHPHYCCCDCRSRRLRRAQRWCRSYRH